MGSMRGRLSRRTAVRSAVAGAIGLGMDRWRPAGAQDAPDATPVSATRVIAHPLGVAEVPVHPERVVAIGSAVDIAAVTGVVPVGIDDRSANSAYLASFMEGIPTVGSSWELDLEKIVALKPDLILALDVVIESVYDQLVEIAPTVGVDFVASSNEWKTYNHGFAEALGQEAAFAEAMAAYEEKAGRLRTAIDTQLGEPKVAILRATPENLRFDLTGIFMGSLVFGDAGLALPPALAAYDAENPDAAILEISREQLGMADGADVIFVWSVSGDPEADQQAIAAMLADPLLGQLDAVRNGRVYAMGDHWFSESVLGASMMLDDLERVLLTGAATPVAS
ncbi:MAG: ABC transporter substrate-binding protein [Thermomicrobiales bacterium]